MSRPPPAGVTPLDHTADVALELDAADFATLLERAALGMDWLLRDDGPPPPPFETREVDLGGRGREPALALRELLRELLRWHERDGFAPAAVEVVGRRGGRGVGVAGGRREGGPPTAGDLPSDDTGGQSPGAGTLRIRVRGAAVEARPLREIKGVTLHGLAAEPRGGRWWGRVVFDV